MKQGWVVVLAVSMGVSCGSNGATNPTEGAPSSAASAVHTGSASASPTAHGPGDTPLYVDLGGQHGCAVNAAGAVKCWGQIDEGQLGNGMTTKVTEAVPAPVAVIGLDSGMVAVAAGGHHSCALGKDGSVQCWGNNAFGQLGNDRSEDSVLPVKVVGLPTAVEIQAGGSHTCAKLEDATLRCWGSNRSGELGDGTGSVSPDTDAHTPREVLGLGAVRSFSLGERSTCAVTQAGSAKCWGGNTSGQLGNGAQADALSPVQVMGLETGVAQININSSFACAVTDQGTAKCWGFNDHGQLGNQATEPSLVPVDVIYLTDATVIQAGYAHACALLADASVKCWGDDSSGQLGSHTDASNKQQPGPGLAGVIQLSTTGSANCAVLSSPSTIQCWGTNSYGELGDDGGSYSRKPRALPGF